MGIPVDLRDLVPTTPFLLHEFGMAVNVGRRHDPGTPKGSLDDDVAGAPLWSLVGQLAKSPVLDLSPDALVALGKLVMLTLEIMGDTVRDLGELTRRLRRLGLRRSA